MYAPLLPLITTTWLRGVEYIRLIGYIMPYGSINITSRAVSMTKCMRAVEKKHSGKCGNPKDHTEKYPTSQHQNYSYILRKQAFF